jgi:hypothetical protein
MKPSSQRPLLEEKFGNTSPGKSEQQPKQGAVIFDELNSALDPKMCPFCLNMHDQEGDMIYEFSIDFIVKTYQNLMQFDNYQQYVEEEIKLNGHYLSEMPESLNRMFPQLQNMQATDQKYLNNPIFLYRKVKVCDDCFECFNDIQQVQMSNNYQVKMGAGRDKQICDLTKDQLRFVRMIQQKVDVRQFSKSDRYGGIKLGGHEGQEQLNLDQRSSEHNQNPSKSSLKPLIARGQN